jgi:hypothetical protein
MSSASLLARMNFAVALAQNKIPGVKVDAAQFAVAVDPSQVERSILLTEPSTVAKEAIQAGVDQQQQSGALVAGLTLGSPDFQRR